jgi:hypothetical protein
MYQNIKSKVQTNEESSAFFDCLNVVRQGVSLSPFLFSIYLNDLENFLQGKNVKGTDTHLAIEDAHMYLKLLILLYADDTVIFSENEHDMQNALKYFKEYCDKWRLTVNVDKTKIVIFRKGRRRRHTIFNLGNENIEILEEYKYPGIYFTRTGSFIKTKKYLAEQANKALFSLLRKINQLSLHFDIQIDLFEKTIKPVLLYGSEIWGFGNFDILERVQLKFYKYIFGLKKSTPSYMIFGESGVMPLSINIKHRVINFWIKLIYRAHEITDTLSQRVYDFVYQSYLSNKVKSGWMDNIKNILCSLGYSGILYLV